MDKSINDPQCMEVYRSFQLTKFVLTYQTIAMKKSLFTLGCLLPFVLSAQLFTAQTVTVNTTNPDSCTAVNIDVQAYLGCINFTVGPGTYQVRNNAITLAVSCRSSPICAGAISYPITNFSVTGLSAGTYSITAEAYLDAVLINSISGGNINVAPCGVTSVVERSIADLKVFPNPAKETLLIQGLINSNESLRVQLFDITGKEQSIPLVHNTIGLQMDLSKLRSGIYFLQLSTATEQLIKKILVD